VSEATNELDGRRARRGRNRVAVVDALLELFREGDLNPAVTTVAERSGVSLRSVFRYFDDLDEMGRMAIARHAEGNEHLLELKGLGTGSREERIKRLVEQRFALYEVVAPVVRASLLRAPFQPVIAAGIAERRAFLRDQLEQHFAKELKRLRGSAREAVAAGADALTSFETAELLRVERKLSPARSMAIVRGSLDRLLP
jgi:AcrR family transcriptional regulator